MSPVTASSSSELAYNLERMGVKLTSNRTLFQGLLEQTVHKSKATDKLKKEVLELARRNQGQLQREITNALLRSGKYGPAGTTMSYNIQRIPVYKNAGSRRARAYVNKYYGGSWYKYKATKAGGRIKRNKHGLHKVAASKQFKRKPTRQELEGLEKYKASGIYTKERAAELEHKITHEQRLGYIDTDLRFKTDKSSRKKQGVEAELSNRRRMNYDTLPEVKSALKARGVAEPHATARSLLAAKYLNDKKHSKVPYSSRKGGKQYNVPYVSTGLLAEQLGKSFKIIDVVYVNHNKQKSQFTFSMKYSFDVSKLRYDVKEAWIYSKYDYKRFVLSGTHAMAEEYLQKILVRNYGKGRLK